MGQGSVFTTRITASSELFLASALIFFVFYMVNILIARRLAPARFSSSRSVLTLAMAAGLVLAFFIGAIAQAQWEPVLRYFNSTPFGSTDPVFNKDISFYIFTLPVYSMVQTLLTFTTVIIAAAVAVIYGLALGKLRLTSGVKAHLSALGAIFLLLFAWNYQLSIYNLVYSTRGVVFGASYTDVNAQWMAYNILTWITIAAAVILMANVVLRATKALAATAVVWIVVTILLGQVYPGIVQNFQVKPNEQAKEKPYIEYNIKLTRQAYGLGHHSRRTVPG